VRNAAFGAASLFTSGLFFRNHPRLDPLDECEELAGGLLKLDSTNGVVIAA
jgi:hypothetical protein